MTEAVCPEILELPLPSAATPSHASASSFLAELENFREFGASTRRITTAFNINGTPSETATFVNEFWTAKQRDASRLHEISFRACFKPQLPRFFIERLTQPGDIVHDPFMGRGTTPLEAAMLGRIPFGSDINPLSTVLTRPRLSPPTLEQVAERLQQIDFNASDELPEDLLVFFHPATLREISSLKHYLLQRQAKNKLDSVDDWIRLVALNRLTGHSAGFFSVYTLPPNQAVSVKSQRKINADRNQIPPRRAVPHLILKKSRVLLSDCDAAMRRTLATVAGKSLLLTRPASATPEIPTNSVSLVVTSPPFLDVVDYAGDNWLRCWFLGIDPASVKLTQAKKLDAWQQAMSAVFHELYRILKPGGHVAFEVGEVRGGKIKLEEAVLPCGVAAGLEPLLVLINDQKFTKTANCWGVNNRVKGTNTNRVVVFTKAAHQTQS
jgi:DNA modification methylase